MLMGGSSSIWIDATLNVLMGESREEDEVKLCRGR
jgi:hypothetical protein